jgi:glycine/D-amino acid oxidase-like deaminating enzyme
VVEPARHFARVRVSAARVIRTVVGLRPFRPSGFVVRADRLDARTIVHNYGHGGGGMTMSWGTAHLAVELGILLGGTHERGVWTLKANAEAERRIVEGHRALFAAMR